MRQQANLDMLALESQHLKVYHLIAAFQIFDLMCSSHGPRCSRKKVVSLESVHISHASLRTLVTKEPNFSN